MTAQRWWVRLGARWLARVDGVSNQIRLAMLGLTGLSTATLTLREYGHGRLAWPLIGTLLVGTLVYTYLFTEGGVWNQMARDRSDLANNYSDPSMYMQNVMLGVATFVAVNGREPDPEERRAIEAAVRDQWETYREGIELDGRG